MDYLDRILIASGSGYRAVLALFLTVLLIPNTSGATTLPAPLLAKLNQDESRAKTDLTNQRRLMAHLASAQRKAVARLARSEERAETLRNVIGLVEGELSPKIERSITEQLTPLNKESIRTQRELEAASQQAGVIQSGLLDARRRKRAIKRAVRSEQVYDTKLGSWRFGAGGMPVSAQSIDQYLELKGSPMTGAGNAFLEAGLKYEIDPRLVVAIAGAESYFGVTTCASFNAWGWGCPSGPYRFGSWKHAIETVTKGLAENYVSDGLTSVGRIHLRYAPPGAKNDPTDLNYGWARNVATFLIEQGGDPQNISGTVGPSY